MKNMTHAALVGAVAAALAACGGGDGDGGAAGGPAVGIAGFYSGTLEMRAVPVVPPVVAEPVEATPVGATPMGAAAAAVATTSTPDHEGDVLALVLESGEYFVLSDAVNGWNLGLQGSVALAAGSTLQSTNSKAFFENEGSSTLTVDSASYVAGTSLTAELADSYYGYSLSMNGFSNTTQPRTFLSSSPEWYGYGKRTGHTASPSWGSFVIDSSGVLSGGTYTASRAGSPESCTWSGQINPVPGGFTLSVTFGTGCYWEGQTLNGWLLRDPSYTANVLRGILLKADRSEGEIIEFGDNP